jgi:hypothetical protein
MLVTLIYILSIGTVVNAVNPRRAPAARQSPAAAAKGRWHALRAAVLAVITCGLLPLLMAPPEAQALPLPTDELERLCWSKHTRLRTRPSKDPTAVDFSNLRDGYTLRSPFVVGFAVRGMGVVPAGKVMQGTGHHHVLIDTPLPRNVGEQIPFSNTHKHFGKGQTFAQLDLPPGKHTLRLLFADHDHKPYYVFSPEIHLQVAGPRGAAAPKIDPRRFDASCAAWYEDEVSRPRPPGEWLGLANLRDGEPVTSPLSLHFGVEGYGVCAVGQTAERTGHFILQVVQGNRTVQTTELRNGATQATLALPNGNYQVRLRFVDGVSGRDLLPPYEHSLPVTAQERM